LTGTRPPLEEPLEDPLEPPLEDPLEDPPELPPDELLVEPPELLPDEPLDDPLELLPDDPPLLEDPLPEPLLEPLPLLEPEPSVPASIGLAVAPPHAERAEHATTRSNLQRIEGLRSEASNLHTITTNTRRP
jgi:hypothetical protein